MIGDNFDLVQYEDGWYVNSNLGEYGPFASEEEARSNARGLPSSHSTPQDFRDFDQSFRLIAD